MFVELIDSLRCTAAHEESWLVAAASRTENRHIIEGTLGCPVCYAEYPIREGAVWYGAEDAPGGTPDIRADAQRVIRRDADEAVRLMALLNIDDRGGLYVLGGDWGMLWNMIDTPESARLLVIASSGGVLSDAVATSGSVSADPSGVLRTSGVSRPSILRGTGDALPLALGAARGIALDRTVPALVQAAVLALAPNGRLLAPVDATVPDEITLLARDDRHWVGERRPTPRVSALVTPRRATPRTESQ